MTIICILIFPNRSVELSLLIIMYIIGVNHHLELKLSQELLDMNIASLIIFSVN